MKLDKVQEKSFLWMLVILFGKIFLDFYGVLQEFGLRVRQADKDLMF